MQHLRGSEWKIKKKKEKEGERSVDGCRKRTKRQWRKRHTRKKKVTQWRERERETIERSV